MPRRICFCPLFSAGHGLFLVHCVRHVCASLLAHTHRASLRSLCSRCEVFFYIFLFALLLCLGCFLSLYIDYFWVFLTPVHFVRMSKKSLKPATVSIPHLRPPVSADTRADVFQVNEQGSSSTAVHLAGRTDGPHSVPLGSLPRSRAKSKPVSCSNFFLLSVLRVCCFAWVVAWCF